DRAPSMGAALSYYTVFSLAPLLVIVIGIAGLFFGEEAARGAIVGELQGLIGDEGARAINELIENAGKKGTGFVATIVGIVALLVGASGVFVELQDDLDRIWKVPPRVGAGIINFIRARLLTFGMVLAFGFLLLVALVLHAALAALGKYWGGIFEGTEWLLHLINFLISFGVVTALFAMIYKILPNLKIEWDDVWIGAIATAFLFTLGKFVIGLYLGKSAVASSYGAAGAVVILLIWMYYSAQIFLLGAEFTYLSAHHYGSHIGKDEVPASRLPQEQLAGEEKKAGREAPVTKQTAIKATDHH
ncbi:MAG: YihY/virulence factor BrkB family protein, partial [Beggiatoa sp.]|nr:YihY/virulence factor BrkB family protein [Beggiatoa sp.]